MSITSKIPSSRPKECRRWISNLSSELLRIFLKMLSSKSLAKPVTIAVQWNLQLIAQRRPSRALPPQVQHCSCRALLWELFSQWVVLEGHGLGHQISSKHIQAPANRSLLDGAHKLIEFPGTHIQYHATCFLVRATDFKPKVILHSELQSHGLRKWTLIQSTIYLTQELCLRLGSAYDSKGKRGQVMITGKLCKTYKAYRIRWRWIR